MVCFEDEEARNEQLRKDILAEQEPGKSQTDTKEHLGR